MDKTKKTMKKQESRLATERNMIQKKKTEKQENRESIRKQRVSENQGKQRKAKRKKDRQKTQETTENKSKSAGNIRIIKKHKANTRKNQGQCKAIKAKANQRNQMKPVRT